MLTDQQRLNRKLSNMEGANPSSATHTNRLIDYSNMPTGNRGGHNGSPRPYLTPLGQEVDAMSKAIIGRKCHFIGANRYGMYLKWMVDGYHYSRKSVDERYVKVFIDWLTDKGLTVTIEYSTTAESPIWHLRLSQPPWTNLPGPPVKYEYVSEIRYIKLTIK